VGDSLASGVVKGPKDHGHQRQKRRHGPVSNSNGARSICGWDLYQLLRVGCNSNGGTPRATVENKNSGRSGQRAYKISEFTVHCTTSPRSWRHVVQSGHVVLAPLFLIPVRRVVHLTTLAKIPHRSAFGSRNVRSPLARLARQPYLYGPQRDNALARVRLR